MASVQAVLNPKSYLEYIRRRMSERRLSRNPNLRGTSAALPGHYYSPLIDIAKIAPSDTMVPFDGVEWWEHVDLHPNDQRAYYQDLIDNYPFLDFPAQPTPPFRYFTDNPWFRIPDAFALSGVIRKERPGRIVEVGSGFSSAVMLDTLRKIGHTAHLTFVEPNPERLDSLLTPPDRANAEILVRPVQEVPMEVFDRLESGDILFIDSSHVAKVGSDVTFLFLRVLPRLRPGVLVHIHDIFFPHSYPMDWIREGYAWNESIVLRAFLSGNAAFEVILFNSFASYSFPEIFSQGFPAFLEHNRGSLWLRKVS